MLTRKRIKTYFRISHAGQIIRRYFVLNGFDGLYTMLGIIIGAYVSGHHDPRVVLGAGFAGIIALGISGASSAYFTEKAERERTLKELESSMLTDLHNTIHGKSQSFASFTSAFVNGFSPIFAAFIMAIPFLLSTKNIITVEVAFPLSIIIGLIEIFSLGYYLGYISRGNRMLYAIRMLAVAGVTAIAGIIVGQIFG